MNVGQRERSTEFNHQAPFQAMLADLLRVSGARAAQLWRQDHLVAQVEVPGLQAAWLATPIVLPEGPWGELRLALASPTSDVQPLLQLAAQVLALRLVLARQQAQSDHIRDASVDMLAINEEEFGRIILDIHDGPVQNMFAALSQVNLLQAQLAHGSQLTAEDEAELQKRLPRISLLLESSLTEIRNFIGTFRPPEFARRSLQAVVEGLIIQHEELTGAVVELDVAGTLPQVPLPVKIAVYRIIQEALFNAHKHAGVSQHFVRLGLAGNSLSLSVADEGAGFDPQASIPGGERAGQHIGLRGMRDRVRLLGGTFELQSAPGRGTRVQVRIPLHDQ